MRSSFAALMFWFLVTVCGSGANCQSDASDLNEMLTRLETPGAVTESDLIQFESASRDAAERGVPLDVKRMLRIVDDESLPLEVRATSLRVLVEVGKNSGEVLHELARRGRAWVATRLDPNDPKAWSPEMLSSSEMMGRFFMALRSYPVEAIRGDPEAIEFIVDLALSRTFDPGMMQNSVALLISLNLPPETASNYAVSILQSRGDSTSLQQAASLGSLVLPQQREALRAVVHNAGDAAEVFPWGSAYALAHVGDAWVGEEFARRAARVTGTDQSSRYLLRALDKGIAMIRAQSEENGLLDLVRMLPAGETELREWALNRAVEIGTNRQAIRQAVLDFAGSATKDLQSIENEKLRSMRTSSTLFWLKEWGFENDILRKDDLAKVRPHPSHGKLSKD